MKRDLVLSSSEINRKREEERRAEEAKSKKGEDESLPREISRQKCRATLKALYSIS